MTHISPDRQVQLLNARFSNVEQMCASAQAWDLDFKPLSGKQGVSEILRLQEIKSGGVDHGYARFSVALNQAGAPPPGKLTFVLLGENLRQLWCRGHHVDANSVMVFPRGSEMQSVSGRDFETHVLSVDDGILAAICDRNELALPTTSTLGEVFRPAPGVLRWVRAKLHILRTADAPTGVCDYVQIIQKLLIAWYKTDKTADLGNSRGLRNRDRAVRLCLDAINESEFCDLSATDLCDLAGISTRTLEYAFRERFDLGPAAFLRSRRMLAVRKALNKAAPNKPTIGAVAAQFGFWHSGQFARDYKSRFAETPSQTLAGSPDG